RVCLAPSRPLSLLFSHCDRAPRDLLSFPTRRSSDLAEAAPGVYYSRRASAYLVLGSPLGQPFLVRTGMNAVESLPAEAVLVRPRSEEHTSELQSRENLVCRLLLEKKNKASNKPHTPY